MVQWYSYFRNKPHLIFSFTHAKSRPVLIMHPWGAAFTVTKKFNNSCLTADPGVGTLITARSSTFVEIDHETISTAILLPSPDSRRVFVTYKRKYVDKVLVTA